MGCVVNGPGEARGADIGIAGGKDCAMPVSYTHLDVYKRQARYFAEGIGVPGANHTGPDGKRR